MLHPLSLLCAAALALPASAQVVIPATFPVRVGTWNLEHLGQRKNPARDNASWAAIGAQIRELDVAVLAVQEVRDAAAARRLCGEIGTSWTFVIGTTGGFRESDDGIRLGFLFDTDRVALIEAHELLDLPREVDGVPIFHRVPITASFRVKTPARQVPAMDFRLVTCHLKASRGEENQHKRKLEMGNLAAWLQRLATDPDEDHDVLLLGDFNHTYGDPAWEVFESTGLGRYLATDVSQPTIVWFDTPIDHIVAMKGIEDELRPGSFAPINERMLEDKDTWRETYSDHVPVAVTLEAKIDNDQSSFDRGRPGQELPVGSMRAAPEASVRNHATDGDLPKPLGRGDAVRVQVPSADSGTLVIYEGRLLAAPDEWVHLQQAGGTRISLPARIVEKIEERR